MNPPPQSGIGFHGDEAIVSEVLPNIAPDNAAMTIKTALLTTAFVFIGYLKNNRKLGRAVESRPMSALSALVQISLSKAI